MKRLSDEKQVRILGCLIRDYSRDSMFYSLDEIFTQALYEMMLLKIYESVITEGLSGVAKKLLKERARKRVAYLSKKYPLDLLDNYCRDSPWEKELDWTSDELYNQLREYLR